jgi:Flp pilus assembly protein TadG
MTRSITATKPLEGLGSFVRHDRGTVAVITAAAILPLILAMGLAVDVTRAYMLRAKLSAALDAAGLAVGANPSMSASDAAALAQQYINANLGTSGSSSPTPTVSQTSTTVTVSATAHYTTGFMGLAGVSSLPVSASSTISFAQKQGVEVAMVLDNTGSLSYPGGDGTTQSNSNILALKTAAGKFVQTVFGNTPVNNPGIRVGIVPYVAAVNPGPTVAPLMIQGNPAVTTNFTSATATGWMGCVVERKSTFASIRAGQTPLNAYSTVAKDLDASVNDAGYLTQYVWPSNWPVYPWTNGVANSKINITLPPYTNGNMIQGPNQSCPTPAVSMTSSSAALFTSIGADPTTGQAIANQGMEQWQKGGTMGSIGMAWGYRMLSPNGPFAAAGQTTSGWRDTYWQKVVLLMTDGVNDDHQDNGYNDYTGDPTTTNGKTATPDQNTIDLEEEAVCDALRANGVIIYAVFLNSNSTPGNAITYCPGTAPGNTDAANPNKPSPYYFDAENQTELYQAFGTIAKQLSNLRVSK